MSDVDPSGIQAARRYARWHLGDPYWADMIVNAYLNTKDAHKALDLEQGDRE